MLIDQNVAKGSIRLKAKEQKLETKFLIQKI